jgi:hypothetical protein
LAGSLFLQIYHPHIANENTRDTTERNEPSRSLLYGTISRSVSMIFKALIREP